MNAWTTSEMNASPDAHVTALQMVVTGGSLVLAVEQQMDERQRRQRAARGLLPYVWTWLERAIPGAPQNADTGRQVYF